MPKIVKLEHGGPGETWAQAAELLTQGQLVALRSAGGFRVLGQALQGRVVERLRVLPGLVGMPAVVLSQPRQVWDWLPYIRGPALRLVRRFWPGPLQFLAKDGYAEGLWRGLPPAVRQQLDQIGGLPLAVADSAMTTAWTAGTHGPLIQSEAPAELVVAEQAADLWGEDVRLIVDTSVSPHGRVAWVETAGKQWRMLTEGAITQADLDQAALCRIIFVCTGNTCRSPLAAALCRKLLADRLGCSHSELVRHGFCVESAGLAAMMGGAAAHEAVVVAQAHGAKLADHQSRPLNLELVANADLLLTMTQSHLELLESLRLEVGPQPQLLSPRGDDIDDPIGGGPEIYQACAAQILAALQERVPEFLES